MNFGYIEGQTPLHEDEVEGLRIPTIATRSELDEFEQQNIEECFQWLLGQRLDPERVFSVAFVRELHRRMFGSVWDWAGNYRRSNKNLGWDWPQLPVAVQGLCDDALHWHQHEIYPPDELAIRYKHRMVCIHCFANGNGRHSRMMADAIIHRMYAQPLFDWSGGVAGGDRNLVAPNDARYRYLEALRSADQGDFNPLMRFARP